MLCDKPARDEIGQDESAEELAGSLANLEVLTSCSSAIAHSMSPMPLADSAQPIIRQCDVLLA